MNIFYVDTDPRIAARSLCDKHVVKMILESAQMLCTAHHVSGGVYVSNMPYKATHKNHPSNIWVRKSFNHYIWLYDHFNWLCEEYTYRYGKTHKTEEYAWLLIRTPLLPMCDFFDPPQCMPDEYKLPDTVDAYRNYYKHGKSHLLKYTKREMPEWLKG